ncbi:hypothetical protein STRCR_0265 [Streptococcus criceti HS-6]|uniref:Uncharacterized protein n=1 Tax=Streptococcus criceti HS-6 TaxID=873449 RepID=G5JP33_STRCG|nr:hypothetical protein STRCR_0265 [Streptococcus criceti HS-6]
MDTHDFTLFKGSIGHSLSEAPLPLLISVIWGLLNILNLHENTFIPTKNFKYYRLTEAIE